MITAERIKELRQKSNTSKKTSKGEVDVRKLICLQALMAYYKDQFCLNPIALNFDLSIKNLKRWIKHNESGDIESLRGRDRNRRQRQLTTEHKVLLSRVCRKKNQLYQLQLPFFPRILEYFQNSE